MQTLDDILRWIDSFIGGSDWFAFLLLGTGLFFTIYLGLPQIRYFSHALRVVRGKYDRTGAKGDTTHFQALSTALSGTIGTGNIAGVALAINLGGPAALFWMLVTAFFGMTTKFVEVSISHKYRDFDEKGHVAGGPMYYMKKRLNIKLNNGKVIKTGFFLGTIFAIATIFSSFGTGNLPQINSIADTFNTSLGVPPVIVGAVLSVLLALVIIGGIKRIAKVTSKLVPAMAILYFLGAFAVLIGNSHNILPSIASVFTDVFTGSAALGGFLGSGLRYAFNKGVNRGLFSNEAGQGSAPIAHSTARANEPVSEGMVAMLGPFIDTIIICFITGITIISSGAWTEKFDNTFEKADTYILNKKYSDKNTADIQKLYEFYKKKNVDETMLFNGDLEVKNGKIKNKLSIVNSRSIGEDIVVSKNNRRYSGNLEVEKGKILLQGNGIELNGKSLLHSAPLTTMAFTRGLFGDWGKYIVTLGILLFAFSTSISWSYYGDRAVTYLWGNKFVLPYRIIYVAGFFMASFINTTIVWTFSAITIALMTIPNLLGILLMSGEVRKTIKNYWRDFKEKHIG
jgi:alanine or glycine:cation symporter, AGCS family